MNGYFIDKDRKQTHVFANTDRIQVLNNNITDNQMSGHNIKIIDPKANTKTNVSATTTTTGGKNEKLLTIKSGNKYAATELETRLIENECICAVVLVGVDIEVVSPNKEIMLTYEDVELNKRYGGNYRVAKVTAALSKDAEELAGELNVVLKKQK